MEAKELRIGNIVSHWSGTREIGGVLIDSVEFMPTKELSKGATYDDIDGVELTDELMVLLGFKKIANSQFIQYWENGYISLWHRYDAPHNSFGLNYTDQDYNDKYVEIKYVHQLQNLYFALTGQELQYVDK